MSLQKTFDYTKKIYYDVMKDIFKEDFDNEDIQIYLSRLLDEYFKITKKEIIDEERPEPLPGELAHKYIKQFCLNMVVDTYKTEDELTNYINVHVLNPDPYRYLHGNCEEYDFIINNLNDESFGVWYANTSINKYFKLFTARELTAIIITCITPFFIFALLYLWKKFRNEKIAKAMYSEKNTRLMIRFLKYSELLTDSIYYSEFRQYDVKFINEVEEPIEAEEVNENDINENE